MDAEVIVRRDLLVRHLVMPDGLAGTKEIMEFLAREISPHTYIKEMEHYRPYGRADEHPLGAAFLPPPNIWRPNAWPGRSASLALTVGETLSPAIIDMGGP